jgi:hypothetical protein
MLFTLCVEHQFILLSVSDLFYPKQVFYSFSLNTYCKCHQEAIYSIEMVGDWGGGGGGAQLGCPRNSVDTEFRRHGIPSTRNSVCFFYFRLFRIPCGIG